MTIKTSLGVEEPCHHHPNLHNALPLHHPRWVIELMKLTFLNESFCGLNFLLMLCFQRHLWICLRVQCVWVHYCIMICICWVYSESWHVRQSPQCAPSTTAQQFWLHLCEDNIGCSRQFRKDFFSIITAKCTYTHWENMHSAQLELLSDNSLTLLETVHLLPIQSSWYLTLKVLNLWKFT